MKIKHRGITAVQHEGNNHVMLFDESGSPVMHCTFDKPITEGELRSVIDNYFNLKEKFANKNQTPKRDWRAAFMSTFLGRAQ